MKYPVAHPINCLLLSQCVPTGIVNPVVLFPSNGRKKKVKLMQTPPTDPRMMPAIRMKARRKGVKPQSDGVTAMSFNARISENTPAAVTCNSCVVKTMREIY